MDAFHISTVTLGTINRSLCVREFLAQISQEPVEKRVIC